MRSTLVLALLLLAVFATGCTTLHKHKVENFDSNSNSAVVQFKSGEVVLGDLIRIYDSNCRTRIIRGGEPISVCSDVELGSATVTEVLGSKRARVQLNAPTQITVATRFEKADPK